MRRKRERHVQGPSAMVCSPRRQLIALAAVLVTVSPGCEKKEKVTPARKQVTSRPKTGAPAKLTEVEMVAVMEGHYMSARSGNDAMIRGDLPALRKRLGEIATQKLPPAAPASWRPHDARLVKAARSAKSITSMETAGPVIGAIAEACGICHVAAAPGKNIYSWPAAPEGVGLKTAMLTHQWATERMWEGVTGPLPQAWDRGAAALAKSKIFGEKGPTGTNSLIQRESVLRELGKTATATKGLHERAMLYGRLLTTCVGCHREAKVTLKKADRRK